jgi:hypothetical protein
LSTAIEVWERAGAAGSGSVTGVTLDPLSKSGFRFSKLSARRYESANPTTKSKAQTRISGVTGHPHVLIQSGQPPANDVMGQLVKRTRFITAVFPGRLPAG